MKLVGMTFEKWVWVRGEVRSLLEEDKEMEKCLLGWEWDHIWRPQEFSGDEGGSLKQSQKLRGEDWREPSPFLRIILKYATLVFLLYWVFCPHDILQCGIVFSLPACERSTGRKEQCPGVVLCMVLWAKCLAKTCFLLEQCFLIGFLKGEGVIFCRHRTYIFTIIFVMGIL